jgi:DNA-binding GntR family transcriptional regulator
MPVAQAPLPVASQRVADILAERILSGSLPPGARIKQDELAEELNTSRIPVRDALRILETRGLVTLRANAGARVASMSLRDLEISYEIRERIEPLLLADSVPHLTDQDISQMHMLKEQIEATRDVEIFLALDRQFHWTAFRRHRAPQLYQIVERLWDTTQSYRRAFAGLALAGGARIVMAEHVLLLHAVERRDADTASSVLVTHIRRTRVNLRRHGALTDDDQAGEPG